MRIQPITCWRPVPQRAASFASLPYDVYDRPGAAAAVAARPNSFLAVDRPETAFPADHDQYAQDVYDKAAELTRGFQEDGTLVYDDQPCYYLYRLEQDGRAQTGVVCAVATRDYDEGVVRRHENTLPRKEEDRIRHIRALGMQTGPVFLTYRDDANVDLLVERVTAGAPLYDFMGPENVRHTVWRIGTGADSSDLTRYFAGVANAYVADGHHRAASAVHVCHELGDASAADGFLCVLFPASQLNVLPYNRVVRDLNGLTVDEFVARVSRAYEVQYVQKQPLEPLDKGAVAMFVGGRWFGLALRPEFETDHPVRGLDVAALQRLVLGPILGVKDPRSDKRIEFVGGNVDPEGLAARAGEEGVAFSLFPTSIQELFAASDAGLLMPPKSTWFEPKLLSGLWLRPIR